MTNKFETYYTSSRQVATEKFLQLCDEYTDVRLEKFEVLGLERFEIRYRFHN